MTREKYAKKKEKMKRRREADVTEADVLGYSLRRTLSSSDADFDLIISPLKKLTDLIRCVRPAEVQSSFPLNFSVFVGGRAQRFHLL